MKKNKSALNIHIKNIERTENSSMISNCSLIDDFGPINLNIAGKSNINGIYSTRKSKETLADFKKPHGDFKMPSLFVKKIPLKKVKTFKKQ
jgi:hypothetical protein